MQRPGHTGVSTLHLTLATTRISSARMHCAAVNAQTQAGGEAADGHSAGWHRCVRLSSCRGAHHKTTMRLLRAMLNFCSALLLHVSQAIVAGSSRRICYTARVTLCVISARRVSRETPRHSDTAAPVAQKFCSSVASA